CSAASLLATRPPGPPPVPYPPLFRSGFAALQCGRHDLARGVFGLTRPLVPGGALAVRCGGDLRAGGGPGGRPPLLGGGAVSGLRSEEHTAEPPARFELARPPPPETKS